MSETGLHSDRDDVRIDMGTVLGAVVRRLPRILLVTALLCALAYAVLLFVPRMYESTANLLVEPRGNAFTRVTTEIIPSGAIVDDAQVASQIELIRARDTILAVIDAEDLREVPELAGSSGGLFAFLGSGAPASDGRIIAAVNDRLMVTRERDSRLISIAFRSTDPDLAARVANAFAQIHAQRRAGQQIADTADASVWLEREIQGLRERVAAAERRVAEFRVDNDLFVGQNNTSLLDQQLSDFATQITATAERRNAAQSRAQLIRELIGSGQSINGIADVQNSPVVQQLSQEQGRLQGERAQRAATLLPNHPNIRSLDAQIAEIEQQIQAEGRRVASSLEAQARIEADLEESLRTELAALKLQAGTAARETVNLNELEREATAQRDLLNAYLARFSEAAARTGGDSALPDVRIVSMAAPSVTPASPRTGLILLAVALVSLCLQTGAVIFGELLSGRALVARRAVEPAHGPLHADAPEAVEEAHLDAEETYRDETYPDEMPVDELDRQAEAAHLDTPDDQLADDQTWADSIEQWDAPLTADAEAGHRQDDPEYALDDWHAEPIEDEDWPAEPLEETPSPIEADAQDDRPLESWDELPAPSASLAEVADEEWEPARYEMTEEEDLFAAEPESDEPVADHTVVEEAQETAEADEAEAAESAAEAIEDPAEPASEPLPKDQAPMRAAISDSAAIAAMASEMVSGREAIVVIAMGSDWIDGATVSERLAAILLTQGRSVVEIDAASQSPTVELGLTDLAAERADFGAVVKRGEDDDFAYVPWGRMSMLDRMSDRPATLVEALTDIYDGVIVQAGRIGPESTAPLFAHLGGVCVVLVEPGAVTDGLKREMAALGYSRVEVIAVPRERSEVA